jgi:tellurium resistance protein TerZ
LKKRWVNPNIYCLGAGGNRKKKGWTELYEAVDLPSCALLWIIKAIGNIYFGNLRSKDGSIAHSGDDLTGDMDGDDGLIMKLLHLTFQTKSHQLVPLHLF